MSVSFVTRSSRDERQAGGAESIVGVTAQPFYFMVPFWGERFRRYYVDNLLPSLLAPNNLPLLRAEDGHRFLLATTREDWDAIIDLPIMTRLRLHATPTLIEIPKPTNPTAPGSTNAIMHQNVAQRLLVMRHSKPKPMVRLFSPDFIISAGMIAALLAHARAGHHLVLCPSLRQTEEAAIAELERLEYLSASSRASETATPINVPQRVLADILVRYLHPEMAIFEQGATGQPPLAPFRYWRIPNQNGIFIHTFHGVPVLMDYKAIAHHDVACLESNAFENVYVARNFGNTGDFQVVADTDEFCILSLTPAAIGQMTSAATSGEILHAKDGFVSRLLAALSISYCTAGMPLKKQLFRHSVRWHSDNLDEAANAEERKIAIFISSALRYSYLMRPLGALLPAFRRTPAFSRIAPLARRFVGVIRGDQHLRSYVRQKLAFEILRPFKRTVFWFTSGGQDLDVVDPYHFSFRKTAGRRKVSDAVLAASPVTAIILGIGQSNIANEGEACALYVAKREVYNFNFFDGNCYEARDPLLGASHDRSNVLTRVGDLLVERGNYQRVVLIPIAHGGTFVSEWSPTGRMFPRLQWTLERLRDQQIKITHIAWQQGEAEAAQHNPNPEDWVRHFLAMVDAIRAAGAEAPIYVAQSTICCNDPNAQIQTAQRQVVNPTAGILSGPDIDLIGRDERYDGCHLSAAGLRHAAELWYGALCRTS